MKSRSLSWFLKPYQMLLTCLLFNLNLCFANEELYEAQEGDVLFQSLPSLPLVDDLVDAIEGATESPYSHCGVLVMKNGEWFVIEAIPPLVCETPLKAWTARGGERYAIYRLTSMLQDKIPVWISEMQKELGKPYDFRFQEEDENLYCSELISDAWKVVNGKPLGKFVLFKELKWQKYRKVIEQFEGSKTIPLERKLITPRDLAKAEELEFQMAKDFKRE